MLYYKGNIIIPGFQKKMAEYSAGTSVEAVYPAKINHYCGELLRLHPRLRPLYLPDPRELESHGLDDDGLGEEAQSPVPRLIRRYRDRAVVLTTGECFVRCRFCFRKRLWRENRTTAPISEAELEAITDFLDRTHEITDILLSGGDVLTLDDDRVIRLAGAIRAAGAVTTVRICSRAPAVEPDRVTPELVRKLAAIDGVWFVTHFDHPDELTEAAGAALRRLVAAGVPVLNQSVLLAGVNDDPETLRLLFSRLAALRVKPHYLFHVDPVDGVAHFATGVARGMEIMEQLRTRLGSIATPVFALDLPEGGGKVVLSPDSPAPDGRYWSRIFKKYLVHPLAADFSPAGGNNGERQS